MSLLDIFRIKKYKQELEYYRQILTPELQNCVDINIEIANLEQKREKSESEYNKSIEKLSSKVASLETKVGKLNDDIKSRKKELIVLDEEILVQEFGLYQPRFDFAKAEQYKERLAEIRKEQKEVIKSKTAVSGFTEWRVDGNKAKGNKMINDMQKLFMRAFNGECDDIIDHVKYNNYDASLKRMSASCEAISKLGSIMGISITNRYFMLKVSELQLALEYQLKKQEEKEELRAAREELREAAKLQKEIEEQRKKIKKEQNHYQTALTKVNEQIQASGDDVSQDLLDKKAELEAQIADADAAMKNVDYREANQRAGYVYVISNIGAFGENVFKIGMTRRLDPTERVDELGDASVPFRFDIHAMIFTDDAPKLETALHKAFENRRLNMVNRRREYFRVSLDEIKKEVLRNYDKTVEFVDVPDAEQYRISCKMKENN